MKTTSEAKQEQGRRVREKKDTHKKTGREKKGKKRKKKKKKKKKKRKEKNEEAITAASARTTMEADRHHLVLSATDLPCHLRVRG